VRAAGGEGKAAAAATRTRKKARQPAGKRAPAAGKNLVIVESPAKARTINRYLGPDYVVKASMGHVRDLPSNNLGVDLENDFAPTYELLRGRKKVVTELRKYARKAPLVFLATDLDREGEAIAWHLAEELKVPPERLRRVIFNEITAPAIRDAFAHPGGIDQDKVNAQQARRILDRIVGYQVSPLLWRKVAAGLSAGRVQTVTVRLIVEREREIEAFVPEEFWKISAIFTTDPRRAGELEERWLAFLAETDEAGKGPTQAQQVAWLAENGAFRAELVEWDGQRFDCPDAEQAQRLAEALGLCVEKVERSTDPNGKGPAANRVSIHGRVHAAARADAGMKYTVESVQSRTSRNKPPAPFTTASMQQAAAVRLRFSASRTMRIAQELYEGVELPGEGSVGLITYMRTDSVNLSDQAVAQGREFIAETFGGDYLPAKPHIYRSGARAQAAHEAIRPTDVRRTPESLRGALSEEQWRLYDLIWRRFVACQMAPARWQITEAAIAVQTELGRGVFKAVGRQLVFDGYLKVAGMPRHEEQLLPALAEGRDVHLVTLSPTQHFTQPPPRYTEASLVKALEAEGIGRPSTYATIIQTIQARGYVRQIDRRFYPTELGILVTDRLVKHFPDIFDVRFTARMEERLDEIEEGREDWVHVLRDFYDPFKARLEQAEGQMVHVRAETAPSEYTCPNCGKPMVYRWSPSGRYLACTGYPDCKTTFPVDSQGRKIEPKEVDITCPECGKPMVLRRSRYGTFLGCSDYPNCRGTVPCDDEGNPLRTVKEEDIKETCPECGAAMVVRRKGRRVFLGCSQYPHCKATKPLPEGVRIQAKPKPKPEEIGVTCPKCKKHPLVIRTGRRGKFIACMGYPRCKNAYDLDKLEVLKAGKDPHEDE